MQVNYRQNNHLIKLSGGNNSKTTNANFMNFKVKNMKLGDFD